MLDSYGYPADWSLVWLGWAGLRHRIAALRLPSRSAPAHDHHEFWSNAHKEVQSATQAFASSFESLGNGLGRLLDTSETCLQTTRKAIASGLSAEIQSGEEASNTFLQAAALASRTLEFGDQVQTTAPQIRAHLSSLQQLSQAILRREREIAEFMRPAEVVQVLLRIECTGLDATASAPLEALSVEIASACSRVAQTMEHEFAFMDEARLSIQQLIVEARRLDHRLQNALLRRQQLLGEMEAIHASAVEQSIQNEAIASAATSLQAALNELIQSLQFHDIVGQRWQHVEQALAVHTAGNLASPHSRWLLVVQAAQLSEANSEMAAALARIDAALHAVAEVESSLSTQLRAVARDSRRQQLYVHLHSILFEVWNMAQDNATQLRGMDAQLAPLVQLAGKIGHALGQVAYEMRLIALNAQVQAARFGRGTGLEVLAEALRRIADAMGAGGSQLDADSRQIGQLATDLQNCFHQLHQQAAATLDFCQVDVPAMTSRLAAEEAQMRQYLDLATQQSLRVTDCRAELESALAAALSPLEQLTHLASAATAISENQYLADPQVQACRDAALLDQESSRYTMVSETKVLHKLAGNSSGPPPTSPVTGELDLF